MVAIGEGENAETAEEADVGTETDSDGDAQVFVESEAANLTLGNECSSMGLMKTTGAVVAAEGEAARSTRTKRPGACSCSPAARTQEVATQMEMAGEDR